MGAIRNRLVPHIARPGGGFWGWLALRLMRSRNRSMNAWAIALLDLQPTDRVLEIGFGAGYALAEVARRVPQGHVVGVDYSPDAVAHATRRSQAAIRAGRVELHQGDAAALPLVDGDVDKAFCCGLIYYLPDPVAALREVRRVLAPGGLLVLMAREPDVLAHNPVFVESGYPAYAGAALIALLNEAGFGDVQQIEPRPDPTVIAIVARTEPPA